MSANVILKAAVTGAFSAEIHGFSTGTKKDVLANGVKKSELQAEMILKRVKDQSLHQKYSIPVEVAARFTLFGMMSGKINPDVLKAYKQMEHSRSSLYAVGYPSIRAYQQLVS